MNKTIAAALVLALGLGTATACSADPDEPSGGDQGKKLTKVNLALSSPAGAVGQATYTSLPLALGYFEDEGIEVTVNALAGSSPAIQSIDAGQSDIGVIGTGALMVADAAGTDLDAFYTVVTSSFQDPMVPQDSDIQSIADLSGKTIGVLSLESGPVPFIKGLFASAGGDPAKLDFVPVGVGAEALAALQNKRIDVLGLWDDRYAEVENLNGPPLRKVTSDVAEKLGFQVAMMATPKWLAENEAAAVGFARATAKATLFAQKNPEAAVRLHWEVYPDSKPIGVAEDKALAMAVNALNARMENSEPVGNLWGNSTPEQVQSYIDLMVGTGTVPKTVSPDAVWNSKLIEKINDFDVAAVEADAAKDGK